jgi:predicted amidophosphoribosyltransferase
MPRLAQFAQTGTHWIGMGLDLLFPPHCVLCRREMDFNEDRYPRFCLPCLRRLETPHATYCARCGAVNHQSIAVTAQGASGTATQEEPERCWECVKKQLAFTRVVPWGVYRGALRDAVVRMKYPAGRNLAAAWAPLLGERIRIALEDPAAARGAGPPKPETWSIFPDAVTCIPKTWLRRFGGATNSAETVMDGVAHELDRPAYADMLRYIRRTQKQSLLGIEQRWKNVRGALAVRPGFDLRGTHILVIDDIMTTGATANEAARALRAAGAARVTIAVVGRAAARQ